MEWNSTLATGQPVLDEQHRGLFQCLRDLEAAAADERVLFAVYTLTRLKHYVGEHFTAEEALMLESNYPKLKQHIDEHEQFRARLRELQIRSAHVDISMETVEFLSGWLTNHIARSDMDYVPYMRK